MKTSRRRRCAPKKRRANNKQQIILPYLSIDVVRAIAKYAPRITVRAMRGVCCEWRNNIRARRLFCGKQVYQPDTFQYNVDIMYRSIYSATENPLTKGSRCAHDVLLASLAMTIRDHLDIGGVCILFSQHMEGWLEPLFYFLTCLKVTARLADSCNISCQTDPEDCCLWLVPNMHRRITREFFRFLGHTVASPRLVLTHQPLPASVFTAMRPSRVRVIYYSPEFCALGDGSMQLRENTALNWMWSIELDVVWLLFFIHLTSLKSLLS
jgi:hypothetical protein